MRILLLNPPHTAIGSRCVPDDHLPPLGLSRPRALLRLWHRDPKLRDAQRWYYSIGKRVWFYEWANYLFREKREKNGPTLTAMWGSGQVAEEFPLSTRRVSGSSRWTPSRSSTSRTTAPGWPG